MFTVIELAEPASFSSSIHLASLYPLLVPETVTVYVSNAVLSPIVTVNVLVNVGVLLEGLKFPEAPSGKPEAESEIVNGAEGEAETGTLEPALYQ